MKRTKTPWPTHRPRPGVRPDPVDIYWPPDDGYPRLEHKSYEILWCLAQGYAYKDIYKLVHCRLTYPSTVAKRYASKDPKYVLELVSTLAWPLEPS